MSIALLSFVSIVLFFSGFGMLSGLTRVFSLRSFGLSVLLGIQIFYLAVMMVGTVKIAVVVSLLLASFGVFQALKNRIELIKVDFKIFLATLIVLGLTLTVLFIVLIETPIGDWDPSAVWFLHAKMIYSKGSFFGNDLWGNPTLFPWSHTDYPKLFPVLVAGFQTVAGLWNEYLPKLAFIFLFLPVFFFSRFLVERTLSSLFLLILLFAYIGGGYWGGYMDGYLAVYTALSVLFLFRFWKSGDPLDFWIFGSLLGTAMCLKNEGLLIFISLLVSFLVFRAKSSKFNRIFFFAFAPVLMWGVLKSVWGVHSELLIHKAGILPVLFGRMLDHHSVGRIANSLYLKNHAFRDAIFMNLAFFIYIRKLPREIVFLISLIFLYSTGLFAVYLLTPYNLDWHLETSIPRTTHLMTLLAYLMIYIWLRFLESRRNLT